MKKRIIALFLTLTILCTSIRMDVFASEAVDTNVEQIEDTFVQNNKQETQETLYKVETIMDEPVSAVANYSLTERQLYYNFPAYLNNDVANTRETYANRVIDWALDDISMGEEWLASYILCLKDGVGILTSELLAMLGITQTQYDKYVDDATVVLVEKYIELDTASKDSVSDISTLYGKYIETAYDIYEETGKASLIADLKEANSALTDDEVEDIVKAVMEDDVLSDLLDYAGEAIDISFLIANIVQLQEIELTTIDNLIAAAANGGNDNDLFNGLTRLREDITSNIAGHVIKTWLNDKALSKITSVIIDAAIGSFSSGAKLAAKLAIEVVAWMYESNHPSAKQIIEALVLDNFVNILGNSVNNYWYDIVLRSKNGEMKDSLMRKYKLAHDLYYANFQCALEAAGKCADDESLVNLCKDYANAFRNTWTYEEYVDQCLQVADKDVDAGVLVLPDTSDGVATGGQQGGVQDYDSTASIQAKFNEVKANFPVGTTWTGNWGGAWQCFGFARMVFSKVFGCEMPSSYCNPERYQYRNSNNVVLTGQLTGNNVTVANIKNLMSQGKLGDIIQANGGTYGQHTMVFEACTDTGVLVYDCNASINGCAPCTINEWTITWEQLASWYGSGTGNGISLYHAANYENIYGDGTGLFYDDSVNFVIEDGVLVKYNGWQSFVEIPDSVTEIGEKAFYNNKTMVSVTIPDSVTSIGSSAFENCTALAGVSMPDTVESVGNSAFFNCSNLEYLKLSNSIVEISGCIFMNCISLRNIDLPDSVTEIGGGAFQNCKTLTEVVLPKNLVDLYSGSFAGCSNLEKIYIPKSLCYDSGIGFYGTGPFADCNKLRVVEFENGVTETPNAIFQDCDGIVEIDLPDSITTINSSTFYNAKNLKRVTMPKGLVKIKGGALSGCISLEEINLPDTVTEIGSGAFQNCKTLTEVVLPKNLVDLYSGSFAGCSNLEKVYIPKSLCYDSGIGFYGTGPFADCNKLRVVEFENGVTETPNAIFQDCDGIVEIDLPDSIKTINNSTFYNAINLKRVTMPKGLVKIEGGAFSGCISLEEINLSDTVTEIGSGAFQNCICLEEIVLSEALTTISTGVFQNCSSLQSVLWKTEITTIPQYTFYGCTSLQEIDALMNIEKIDNYAFYNCDSLTELTDLEKLETIGNYAFYDCDNLTTISLSDSVKTIYNNAFASCDELSNVSLGMGITKINSQTFMDCPKLASIVIPYNVTEIGSEAFKNDTALVSVTLPQKTTTISSNAFSYPGNMTIYGVAGSYAENFAAMQGMRFVERSVPATSVTLPQTEYVVNKYDEFTLTPSILPANFTDLITYKSSNTDVVTVSEDGVVYAAGGGTATIKITVGNCSTSCKVTVVQPVTGIYIDQYSVYLDGGETYQLTAEVYPNDAYNKVLKWESSDESIATVSQNGLVTAKKKGTCTIKALATDGSGRYDTCTIYVLNNIYTVTSLNAFESAHPYEANSSDIWSYILNGASAITVTFNKATYVEDEFDYIYIYDVYGNQIGRYTGNELSGKSITLQGNTVKVKLVSDNVSNEYGFKVDSVVASGVQKKYNIAFHANGATSGAMSSMTNCVVGTSYKLSANAFKRTGYTFVGWNTKANGTGVSYANGANVKNLSTTNGATVTLYAIWVPNTYHLSYNANGATSGYMANLNNCKYDVTYALNANAYKKKGYTFNGWNTKPDGTGIAYTDRATIRNLATENGKTITLYAQWTQTKYKVTYKLNGGKNNKSNKTSYYVTTSTFKLKNPTRKGYTFKGWYSDKKCTKKVTKITKGTTGNKTYYAKWAKTKYKITYNLNKGKNNKSNKKTYYVTTSTFKLKNPTRKGYVFKGWYSDKKFKKKVTKIKKGSTGNLKLYAKWVKKK